MLLAEAIKPLGKLREPLVVGLQCLWCLPTHGKLQERDIEVNNERAQGKKGFVSIPSNALTMTYLSNVGFFLFDPISLSGTLDQVEGDIGLLNDVLP